MKKKDLKNGRLIIVSNRLPVVLKKSQNKKHELKPASGGLITAMTPVFKKKGGLWIGWAGNYLEERIDVKKLLKKKIKNLNYKLIPVEIGLGNYELYYKGFSNEVLWPLFHNFSTYCNFLPKYYEAFKKVNRQFANTVIENLTENDFVWVHDYHLINTAKNLREKKINNKIAFFLHIPFPPAETFKRMPWRTEILNALFYYDLIGFQTPWDKQNFLDAVKFLIKDAKIKNENKSVSSIKVGDMKSKAGSFPISMDFNEFSIPSKNPQIDIKTKEIQKEYPNQTLMLGVDRLDYTKGIPQKLKAYRRVLEKNPQIHNKIKLVQIMIPSREDIIKYADLKMEIEQLVGEINGKFSKPGWIPIQYRYRSLSRSELLAYYKAAKIALITPLKDGMNLVAKEYCAAHNDKNGVLILSDFAGAMYQLQDYVLPVNPFDENSLTCAIEEALYMKKEEKRERMQKLRQNIKNHDINWWVDTFIKTV